MESSQRSALMAEVKPGQWVWWMFVGTGHLEPLPRRFPAKEQLLPSQLTDPCRKTTFLLERACLHFHVSWLEGSGLSGNY